MNKIEAIKKRFPDSLKEGVCLRDYTVLATGGVVDFLLEVTEIQDLIDAIKIVNEHGINYILISSGSSSLFSDYGFPGLVIINRTSSINYLTEKSQVIVDSGVRLPTLIMLAAQKDLGGIEPLINLNDSVGGMLYGNLSFNLVSLNSFVRKLTILTPRGEIVTYKGDWLNSLRGIKKLHDPEDKQVILTTVLQLQRSRQTDIVRKVNQVKITNAASAKMSGEIFKNPSFDKTGLAKRLAVDLLRESDATKIKSEKLTIYPDYPNRIINHSAQAVEIRDTIDQMRQRVLDKTEISLVESIEYLGVW